ncbi:MAG: type II 3-dehydroquinate dehydratase [Alphaproteobacteria bacterium]|jgi:3-dehydroquinate dehydratase-2|nr:type II 3-dehydroquinate dehydratase [Alphaproteobacteria bacterium]MDP6876257.1 type II 3-dehydroquinate dehydratase [Alphaproteobacteria bacterium]
MPKKILVLNGPNLNMLGSREPSVYGHKTLADVNAAIQARAAELGVEADCRQSNSEGELVTWIQQARGPGPEAADAIIINAGAYSHTSVAILDALRAAELPVYEVHLSNIYQRESFRHHSYISAAAVAVICGLGPDGYLYALTAAAKAAG